MLPLYDSIVGMGPIVSDDGDACGCCREGRTCAFHGEKQVCAVLRMGAARKLERERSRQEQRADCLH